MKTKLFLFASIAVFLTACKGEKGDTGPPGAQSNANVQSFTVTVESSSWIQEPPVWKSNIDVSAITQSIIDHGTVSVFISYDGSRWWALPSSSVGAEFNYYFFIHNVEIIYSLSNGNTPNLPPPTSQFKIVTITGSIARDNPDIDWNNYSEIKANFNLTD